MFFTDMEVFKTQQIELHRRAAHYRLVKSLEKPKLRKARVYAAIGAALISLGQGMINKTQTAHQIQSNPNATYQL